MVTEWFISIGTTIAQWGIGLFGNWELPDWLLGLQGMLAQLWASVVGLGAWIDWGFISTVALSVIGLWGVVFLVKGVRWLVGWLPTMGGS